MSTTPAVSRLAWIDFAKAVGIILVVLGHVNSGIGKTPGLAMGDGLMMLNAVIYSFHMPLFFVLAGFVVQLKRKDATPVVLRDVLWSLAVPYVLWSALWIGMKVGMRDFTDNPVTLGRLASIFWEPIGHMWFLYHLFCIRLGWHAVERLLPLAGRLAGLGLASLASLGVESLGADGAGLGYLLQNFAFFGFGLLVLPHLALPQSKSRSLALAVLGLGAWGVAYAARPILSGPLTGLLLGLIGTCAVVLLSRALPEPKGMALRLLGFVGEASMAIYVLHLFVTTATRKALTVTGQLSESSVLLVATPLGVLIPAVVFWCILRSSGLTGIALARYIGLGQARNSRYLGVGTDAGRSLADVGQTRLVATTQTGSR